ncbi:MAG: hypothetical protein ACI9VR_001141 [Cognaticolwellia sp.]|jgi:hypothetical protein
MLIMWTIFAGCSPCEVPATGGKALVWDGSSASFQDVSGRARRIARDGDGALWTQADGALFKDGLESTQLVGPSEDLRIVDGRAVFLEINPQRQVWLHDPAGSAGVEIPESGNTYDAGLWGDSEGLHVLRVGDPGGLFLHSYAGGWELPYELVPGLPQRNWLIVGPGPSWARAAGLDFRVEAWDGTEVQSIGTIEGVDFVWALIQDDQGELFARVGSVDLSQALVAHAASGCVVELSELVAPFALVPQEQGVLAFGVTSTGEPSTVAVYSDCSLGARESVGSAIDASLHKSVLAGDGENPVVLLQYEQGSGSETFEFEEEPLCL